MAEGRYSDHLRPENVGGGGVYPRTPARNRSRLPRMMARTSGLREALQPRRVLHGIGQALGVGEVRAEDQRLDADHLDGALHVLLREGRHHEAGLEQLAGAHREAVTPADLTPQQVGVVELA